MFIFAVAGKMCIRDRKQAVRFLKQMDKQHKKYYEFYTGEKWGKPENYDLCINLSLIHI